MREGVIPGEYLDLMFSVHMSLEGKIKLRNSLKKKDFPRQIMSVKSIITLYVSDY